MAELLAGRPPREALRQFAMKYGQFGGPEHSPLGLALLDYQRLARSASWPHSADAVPDVGPRGVPGPLRPRSADALAVRAGAIARGRLEPHRSPVEIEMRPVRRVGLGLPGGPGPLQSARRPGRVVAEACTASLGKARMIANAGESSLGDPAGSGRRRGRRPWARRRRRSGTRLVEKRVAVVVPGRLVRGAWQRPWPLRRLIAREKIRTIVTLTAINRDDPKYVRQARVVRDAGVDWIIVPMRGSRATLEQMAEAADLLADPRRQPVFFHCVAGHHRTSLVHAAYLIRHQGFSADGAWRDGRGAALGPARGRRRRRPSPDRGVRRRRAPSGAGPAGPPSRGS